MYYHTPSGRHYHVAGCSHLIGREALPGLAGLLPCADCCNQSNHQDSKLYNLISHHDEEPNQLDYIDLNTGVVRAVMGSQPTTPTERRTLCIVQNVLTHPELQFHLLSEFKNAPISQQCAEYYRILYKHKIIDFTGMHVPDAYAAMQLFIQRSPDSSRQLNTTLVPYELDDHQHHMINFHETAGWTQYEKDVLCYTYPDRNPRSTQELECVYEVFSAQLWSIYDKFLKFIGIPEDDIKQALRHIRFVSCNKMLQLLHDRAQNSYNEEADTVAITSNTFYGDKKQMYIYVRDDTPDIMHTLMHEVCHYLSSRLLSETRMKRHVASGISILHVKKPLFNSGDTQQRLAYTEEREALNEVFTDFVARYLLQDTPLNTNEVVGYHYLENNIVERLWPLFGSPSEICKAYFANDWEQLQHNFRLALGKIPVHGFSLEKLNKQLTIMNNNQYSEYQRIAAHAKAIRLVDNLIQALRGDNRS